MVSKAQTLGLGPYAPPPAQGTTSTDPVTGETVVTVTDPVTGEALVSVYDPVNRQYKRRSESTQGSKSNAFFELFTNSPGNQAMLIDLAGREPYAALTTDPLILGAAYHGYYGPEWAQLASDIVNDTVGGRPRGSGARLGNTILRVGGTVIGGLIGGPAGAAAGAGLGTVAAGGGISDALRAAALAYVGGQIANGVGSSAGVDAYESAILAGATEAEAQAAASAAIDAAASVPAAAPGLFDVIGQSALRGGVSGALSSVTQGVNPLVGAAQGALTGGVTGGTTYAGNELWDQISSSGLFGQDVAPETFSPLAGPLASPESVESYLSAVPEAVPGMTLSVGGADLDITAPGALEAAAAAGNLIAPESAAPVVPKAVAPAQTPAQTPVDYVKTAKQVYSLYQQLTGAGADVQEFEIPEREEGQSDEEYLAAVGNAAVEYLSLDPDAMREAGLVPGTDEYLNYILEQADAIIAGVFGADPSALLAGESVEDLQAVLRDLTENEATQLAQAMYVRGAFNQLSAQVSASDPFTGQEEKLGLLPGEMVNPNVAAQQRGYARALENIAGLSGPGAREALTGLFGRDVDLFGLQSAADTRAEAARKAERELEYETFVDEYGNLQRRRKTSK